MIATIYIKPFIIAISKQNLWSNNYSTLEVIFILILSLGILFVVRFLTRLFKSYLIKQIGTNTAIAEVFTIFTQYLLSFVGLIVLWQLWGLDVSDITISVIGITVAIGLSLSKISNNLFSSLILNLEKPIKVGDFINLGNITGTVEKIGAISTQLSTLDQVTIIIPNSRLLEAKVINWSYSNEICLHIPLVVAYGCDVNTVKTALLEACKNHPDVLVTPRPQVNLQSINQHNLLFELSFWIREPQKQLDIKSDINYRIYSALRRYEISLN